MFGRVVWCRLVPSNAALSVPRQAFVTSHAGLCRTVRALALRMLFWSQLAVVTEVIHTEIAGSIAALGVARFGKGRRWRMSSCDR